MEVPTWVLMSAGIYFILSTVLYLALIIGLIVAWGKIKPVLDEVQQQVRRIGDKTDAIATTAKGTVDNIQQKTTQILGAAEESSAHVTQRIRAASAALTTLFVAARIYGFVRGLASHHRDGASARARGEKTTASPVQK